MHKSVQCNTNALRHAKYYGSTEEEASVVFLVDMTFMLRLKGCAGVLPLEESVWNACIQTQKMCSVFGNRKQISFQSLAGKILGKKNKLTDEKLEQGELLLLKTLLHLALASLTLTGSWCYPRRHWRPWVNNDRNPA